MLKMTFIDPEGARHKVEAPSGITVLEVARRNRIDIEGACEGSLSCSTCHVIVDPSVYGHLPAPDEDEEDMLDLAFGLTRTSRLGCRIVMTEGLDGLTVRLPARFQG
jgi:2Fe-2S ferredoxin